MSSIVIADRLLLITVISTCYLLAFNTTIAQLRLVFDYLRFDLQTIY